MIRAPTGDFQCADVLAKMHVTLRQLRALVAVAENSSFTEAAKNLNLSQAALSGLIKDLETQVDIRLFDRTSRKVLPTAAGEAFVPQVVRVLADLDEALDSLGDMKALRRGLVRVAAPESISCTFMPSLIAEYGKARPGINIRFDDISIESVFSGLQDGSIDVGFGPEKQVDLELVERRTLWLDPLWVALRQEDVLAEHATLAWSDLRERAVFCYMRSFDENVLNQLEPADRPSNLIRVHRVNTALGMLHAVPGVAVCPSTVKSIARGFGLTMLPLLGPVIESKVCVYFRKRQHLSSAVDDFIQFAAHHSVLWREDQSSCT